ncbi:MAG: Crp/Fnr family transcriptional regulator [candidate division KSB1 bacterium]|jgi:CRP/FNR family transcriptional regulator|nr:Crp/Fnr family transcriptional regulator [candidate division KSB1 bacterium]
MDPEQMLTRIGLFQHFSAESIRAIAQICLPKKVDKGQILFSEGEKAYSLYILVSGAVQLYKTAPDGREVVIKVVKPGEMFAEAILFEQERYPASAVALRESTLYLLPRVQFHCLLEQERFRNEFIGNLLKKLRFLTEQMAQRSAADVEERLWCFLEEQFGCTTRVVSPLSKKTVAAAIGATPETLSRVLRRLQGEGKLRWERRVMEIDRSVWEARQ